MNRENAPPPLDPDACYAALSAHDSRFDGRFFCAVSSTGIYCRPICRVKLPKQSNCSFFASAAAAEAAGYRPCLKCRPELAPGLAPADAAGRLAGSAARAIEEDCLSDSGLADLAARLGISDRHLRRVFFAAYGVSAVQFLQTRRLLLAKSLLTDTRLPVTEVAMAAGFGSIRRFNDLFKKKYRLAPTRFRKTEPIAAGEAGSISLLLAYRPPYAWDRLISFLAARALAGVEWVGPDAYRRTVAIGKGEAVHSGWISVAHLPRRQALSVTVASSLLPVLPQLLARVRQFFDLDCDPWPIFEKLESMERLAAGIRVPGIRLPGCFDPFEICTRAVLGQQVTVKAGRTLAARLAEGFGAKIETPFPELSRTFPLAHGICALETPIENRLGPLGITASRARTILALAKGLSNRELARTLPGDPLAEMRKLLELPGIGPWTAGYIAMRALGWPDAFLDTDCGVKKALSGLTGGDALSLARTWSPWRSYATMTLWESLHEHPGKTANKKEQTP